MNSREPPQIFRLIACDRTGLPSEDLGDLPRLIRENCRATAELYRKTGFAPPWIGYLALFNGAVVGCGGFVGPPKHGRVEIAYFTLPEYEGKGMASRTADKLVSLARAAPSNCSPKPFPNRTLPRRSLANCAFTRSAA